VVRASLTGTSQVQEVLLLVKTRICRRYRWCNFDMVRRRRRCRCVGQVVLLLNGGTGGHGLASSITGSSVPRAGGGGGGSL
jgi:hypothetical protein